MIKNTREIHHAIYAGVLGKIIGVYLGRPVEGWSYQAIIDRFGEVDRYVNTDLGIPLIVADDDISGTFGFFRAMEDHGYPKDLHSYMVGETWLNYIIKDKTILWWGGLGRSTEHTAYLRLEQGIQAPRSGSMALNGKTLAEQIGAQIFIDAFAMMCPNDPDRAVRNIREAARVSHDGMAVEAACFLGAMEADAFTTKNMDSLMDRNLMYVSNKFLIAVIEDVRSICSKYNTSSWREARSEIDAKYGYHKFNGPCHIIPNHAMVLASLILGGDDFHRSITIASSAAWDTDCNAGNVGCLNGIRLGLDGINGKPELRQTVADRLLVVTADGGSCVSDAVIESRKIITSMEKIYDLEPEQVAPVGRFTFEFSGSLQGFQLCPYAEYILSAKTVLSNGNMHGRDSGLLVELDNNNGPVSISTPTFINFNELAQNFGTMASPTLYEGQTVSVELNVTGGAARIEPYIMYYTDSQESKRLSLGIHDIGVGKTVISDVVPSIHGMPIFRFGLHCTALEQQADILATWIDWSNTPRLFAQKGMMLKSIWETRPYWFQAWVGSVKYFAADFFHTFCISHPEANGVVSIGTQDWSDYQVETSLNFSLHDSGGIILRNKGLRQYYAVLFSKKDIVSIIERTNEKETVLSSVSFTYEEDRLYQIICTVKGNKIEVAVDGETLLQAISNTYERGGCGYRIDNGTMVARDFIVRSC